ncbi:MAG: hypothetical protein R3F60_30080 [bacterium]
MRRAAPDAAVAAGPPGTLAWTLAWDATGVQPEAVGWSVTTDLGYRVHLIDGAVTTWDASLVADDGTGTCAALKNHAGDQNETSADAPRVESLVNPLPSDTWALKSGLLGRYCLGQVVVARATPLVGTDGRARVRDRVALALALTWARGGGPATRLEVQAPFGHGALLALPGGPIDFQQAGRRLTLVRSLAGLFDGIDFETSTADNVARDVLRALLDGAELRGE